MSSSGGSRHGDRHFGFRIEVANVNRGTQAAATLFSTDSFLKAWLAVPHHHYTPQSTVGSFSLGDGMLLSGIIHRSEAHGYFAECGPHGLYAAPSPMAPGPGFGPRLTDALAAEGIARLIWNVRFDHEELSTLLRREGWTGAPAETRVVLLNDGYEAVFAGYSATRRNQIRKAQRRAVRIREARDAQDIASYYRLHEELEEARNFGTRYPLALINALAGLKESTLLIAEVEDRVIAGALFFVDGDSMLYWHGGADRAASEFFAMPALMDAAIQRACAVRVRSFNFGGSPSDSLTFFKESFGATKQVNWSFQIQAPRSAVAHFVNRATARWPWLRSG